MAPGGPVREIVTDALEVFGLLLLIAASFVALWPRSHAIAFTAAGLGCIAASVVLVIATRPKR